MKWLTEKTAFGLPRWVFGIILIIDLLIPDPLPFIDEIIFTYLTLKGA